ncbi:MAG: hypothetical protein NTZ74_14670 [Chloroflexi bacterium]|nr:hypothetical protein [Chloroflexota bacterium]
MNFMNLGIGEILFIVILATIIFGPGNMVKTAREIGSLIRKATKSPYWQEIWATRRELNELPKMIAKEANLAETLKDLNRETSGMQGSLSNALSEIIREVDGKSDTSPKWTGPQQEPPAGPDVAAASSGKEDPIEK